MNIKEIRSKFPGKEKNIEELSLLIKTRSEEQPNFSLLLGSGASVTSGVRSGQELVQHWGEKLYEDYLRKNAKPLHKINSKEIKEWLKSNHSDWYDQKNEYASFFQKKFDLPAQRRIFIEGEVKKAKPSLGYCYLTDLVNEKYFNTVFTTNFDDLVNEAFYKFGNIRPIVCAHDSSVQDILVTAKRPKIIKLHGDYLFDDLKCTPNQLEKLSVNMAEKLEQFLREYGLIVCGYAGEDNSIMTVLMKLIERDSFLRNGLYWCIRSDGEISEKLINLLAKNKAYFVVIDGYDELFSQLHNNITNDQLSFENHANESGPKDMIEYWLENSNLYSPKNEIIQKQLDSFKRTRTKTQLGSAFADLYSEKDDVTSNLGLADQEAAQLLRLNTMMKGRDYQSVIDTTEQLLLKKLNKDYQRELLIIQYNALKKKEDHTSALKVCERLIQLEKDDPRHNLRKLDVIDNFNDSLICIDEAISKDRYYTGSYNKKCEKFTNAIKRGDIECNVEHYNLVLSSYRASQKIDPSLRNSAWRNEVKFLIRYGFTLDKKNATERVLDIYKTLSEQDPYSITCARIACLISEKLDDPDVCESNLFDQLRDCATESFPKLPQNLFPIIVSAAIQFENHDFADEMLNKYEKKYNDQIFSSEFSLAKSEFYLDVHQDLEEAIEVLTEAVELENDIDVVVELINLYIYRADYDCAANTLEKYKYLFSTERIAYLEHEILLIKEEFEAAEAVLIKANNGAEYNEDYAVRLTYLALLQKEYKKAKDISSVFLKKVNFSREYPTLIINHEFALSQLGKNVHKHRLKEIQNSSGSLSISAMACLISGDSDEAMKLMLKASNRKYSNYLCFMKWPITEPIREKLEREFKRSS